MAVLFNEAPNHKRSRILACLGWALLALLLAFWVGTRNIGTPWFQTPLVLAAVGGGMLLGYRAFGIAEEPACPNGYAVPARVLADYFYGERREIMAKLAAQKPLNALEISHIHDLYEQVIGFYQSNTGWRFEVDSQSMAVPESAAAVDG